ncbi:uncharacterized protein H6S33_006115 [Morchella sextelata]|uniref:uncharacterized protein n=1 Tax=Morchella sextelata TaxID=1174677 RepID=UPI001D04AAD9|nr:uncharacterized protein H6S33_006115 [Morchella sextelata]KAH0614229.1 hypothetical protein H6S33_006115 [Morchella sextelata]
MPHYTTTPDFSTLFFHNLEHQRRTFSPKFDVYETATSYTLEGDLPGLEKQNLSIEFTDPVTLVIKGHISKKSPSTTTSETLKSGSRTPSPERSLKATVEDDVDEEDRKEKKSDAVVEKRGEKRKEREFKTRQWVSERTVGAFQRSFTFPAGIEQEGVTAGLEHGVLRIVVPKMAPVSRRIEIS